MKTIRLSIFIEHVPRTTLIDISQPKRHLLSGNDSL